MLLGPRERVRRSRRKPRESRCRLPRAAARRRAAFGGCLQGLHPGRGRALAGRVLERRGRTGSASMSLPLGGEPRTCAPAPRRPPRLTPPGVPLGFDLARSKGESSFHLLLHGRRWRRGTRREGCHQAGDRPEPRRAGFNILDHEPVSAWRAARGSRWQGMRSPSMQAGTRGTGVMSGAIEVLALWHNAVSETSGQSITLADVVPRARKAAPESSGLTRTGPSSLCEGVGTAGRRGGVCAPDQDLRVTVSSKVDRVAVGAIRLWSHYYAHNRCLQGTEYPRKKGRSEVEIPSGRTRAGLPSH